MAGRRQLLGVTATVVVMLATAMPAAAAQADPLAGIDATVREAMTAFDVPGIAVAVVKDGQVVLARGWGLREIGKSAMVDEHTLFAIASNTKAFTAAALAILVDEGRLSWDDKVVGLLPGFRLYDPCASAELTVRDLLSHRSGLGEGEGDLLAFFSTYSREEILRRVALLKPTAELRTRYQYQNNMFLAAGQLIPAITGTSWDDFVVQRIFNPVGMMDSVTSIAAVREGANWATPHRLEGGKLVTAPRDDVGNCAPAGAISSSVADMARWLLVQLDRGRITSDAGGERRLFSEAASREMWKLHTPIDLSEPPPQLAPVKAHFQGYGLGWLLRDYRGRLLVSHGGALTGMISRVTLVPEERLGIVVVTNSESAAPVALVYSILDRYLAAEPIDFVPRFKELEEKRDEGAAAAEQKLRSARDPRSQPSLPLERYAGRYRDAWYGDAAVKLEDGRLVLRLVPSPAFVGDLEHWQHDTFLAHWRLSVIPDAFVTFSFTPEGKVDAVKLKAFSPLADFSFDYQDLLFQPVEEEAVVK